MIGMQVESWTKKSIEGVETSIVETPSDGTLAKCYGVLSNALKSPIARSYFANADKTWLGWARVALAVFDDQSSATRSQHLLRLLRDGQADGESVQAYFARKRSTVVRDLRGRITIEEVLREGIVGGLRKEFIATSSLHGSATLEILENGLKEQERQERRTKNTEDDSAKLFVSTGGTQPDPSSSSTDTHKAPMDTATIVNTAVQKAICQMSRQIGSWNQPQNKGGKYNGGKQPKGKGKWNNNNNYNNNNNGSVQKWDKKPWQQQQQHQSGKQPKGAGKQNQQIKCHRCGGLGHRQSECPSKA